MSEKFQSLMKNINFQNQETQTTSNKINMKKKCSSVHPNQTTGIQRLRGDCRFSAGHMVA